MNAQATERRKARIIVVGGEKGGTGKTTTAVNLAVCLARHGSDVLLVDTDLQGSASQWVAFRDQAHCEPRVPAVSKMGSSLPQDLLGLAERYDDIIVDAGGRDTTELRSAMVVADLMISPLQASSFDIWTLESLNKLYKQAKAINQNLEIMVLINRGSTNRGSQDSQQAREMISKEMPDFRIADAEVHERVAYRRSAADGLSVIEQNDDEKAKAEIEALFKEVYDGR